MLRDVAKHLRLALPMLLGAPLGSQEPPRVMPVYLVPRDASFPYRGVQYHAHVLADVRAWYGRVLDGRTFVYEPLVVQMSRHTFAELSADNFQAWWPLLQEEFAGYGWPWNRRSKFKLLFLTHGAGAWAGSDSENGGIDSVSQAGHVDKGNWGGLAVIGDSSVAGVFAGVCPETSHGKADSTTATAWWCSGSTYRGTVAHELGHTWGLPHPEAFMKGFRCADSTAYTIMQCHWWWEKEKLLDFEIVHLRSLDFFSGDTAPAYAILAAAEARSAVRWRRARLEAGDSLVWVDGRGQGTGYPWAIVLDGAGAEAIYAVGGTTLAFDLGVERGTSGSAELRVEADGKPLGSFTAAAGSPPQRIVLDVRGAKRLRFRVGRADGGTRVVLGNARVYSAAASLARSIRTDTP
jgi:hypothetical protein